MNMAEADIKMNEMILDMASCGIESFDECDFSTQSRLVYLYMIGFNGDDVTSDIEITENIVEIFAADTVTQKTEARLKMCRKIEKMAVDATRKYVDDIPPEYIGDHDDNLRQESERLRDAIEDIVLTPMMRRAK